MFRDDECERKQDVLWGANKLFATLCSHLTLDPAGVFVLKCFFPSPPLFVVVRNSSRRVRRPGPLRFAHKTRSYGYLKTYWPAHVLVRWCGLCIESKAPWPSQDKSENIKTPRILSFCFNIQPFNFQQSTCVNMQLKLINNLESKRKSVINFFVDEKLNLRFPYFL